MLESLKQLGELLHDEGLPIERTPEGNYYLAKIIFDLDSGEITCDLLSSDKERAREYLWVGNVKGNKPQLRLTTDRVEYILNEPNQKPHKWAIEAIIQYLSEKGIDERNKNFYDTLKEIRQRFFRDKKRIGEDFIRCIEKLGINKKSISLYTVSVKRKGEIKDLVKEPAYYDLLTRSLYSEGDLVNGICHVCGERKDVLLNPSYPPGSFLIIYNVDKAGFLSGISRDPDAYLRTHTVCPDCKRSLVLGASFVREKLSIRIPRAYLNIFIIPRIYGLTSPDRKLLDKLTEKTVGIFSVAKAYKTLKEVEKTIDEFIKFIEEERQLALTYSLYLLFGASAQSSFAYYGLVQNVPVTRLLKITKEAASISNEVANLFQEEIDSWSIGLDNIAEIYPMRKNERKPLVEMLVAIFDARSYPRDEVIKRALLLARIIRFNTYEGYNIKPNSPRGFDETFLCRSILKYNMFLLLLRKIGVIGMTQEAEQGVNAYSLDESLANFITKQGYEEWHTALFLLGILVGRIGVQQYKKGDSKKSILEKINFDGMSQESIKRLANNVLASLKNYRILEYNEKYYAVMKQLLDKHIEKLENPLDNTFYILSGYAYETLKTITKGGENE